MAPTTLTSIIQVSKAKSLVFAVLVLAFTAAVTWKVLHDVQSREVFLVVQAAASHRNWIRDFDFETYRWLSWAFLLAFLTIMPATALVVAARPFLGPVLAIDKDGAGSYLDGLRRIPFALDPKAYIKVTANGFWFEPAAVKTVQGGGRLALARASAMFNEGPTSEAARRLAALGLNAYLAV